MNKIFGYLVILSFLFSCGNDKSDNMVVNGTIDGLKKGTIYLQKIKDTVLISVDSIQLKGSSNFTLSDEVENPEMYYIALDKISGEKISFFGEKGEITITAKLAKFSLSAKITGSKNNDLLEEYQAMIQKFNGKQLDLIKERFGTQKINDTSLASTFENQEKSLIKRKYYYTTNFAVTNADYEVSPYIALTQLYNANIKLLDTVNASLSPKIKASKYGVELDNYIKEIKKVE